ncbi:hypothetical protein [Clostridium hydrogenum]|uniref:hypothetical protein n=1 Tax=Clostridium hydrogenum TaxID=2855764 RepID=UPI001F4343ED|nr:hypothetical protein [Clostridium hydrogenum]
MISVDFEKLKELYDIVNRFEGTVSENLSRAEAQTSGITASGDRLLRHLNETKRFLDDEISRYQNLERRLNEKANAINFRGLKAVNAVNIDRISEGINSPSPNLYEALFKPIVSGGDASLDNRSSKVELKSEKEENVIDKTLKVADGKVNSAVDMVENAANEIKNFAEEKIEDVDKAIKNVEEYLKSELAELTRQINSVLEEIFKTFENKNFQKSGTDFLILLATDVQELTTNNKEELKVLPKVEAEYENKLIEDFDNFKADAWNEFSKSHPEGAKLLEDTSNKINDLEGIIKKSWELYKKIDPKHAGILAGACTFVKETVEIPYDVAEFCGKQWYNLRTDTKGTLLSWLDTSQKIYGILNPQIPKTAEQLEFEGNLVNSIKNSIDKNLINGDEYTRYKFGTDVVLNIATLFSGKGALKAASEAGKMEDAVKFGKDASEMSKLEKGTSYAEKMSELSSKLKGLGKASEEMFKNTLSEILSLQKSMSDKFGDIVEKLKAIDKDVEIKSEAKEIVETGEKSEVEEKTVNDIINEKNEVGSPVKVDEDIKKVNESSYEEKIETDSEKVRATKSEQLKDVKDSGVNVESKTDGREKKGTEGVTQAEDYGKYSTLIDGKVKEIEKSYLPNTLSKTFTDSNYRTVITEEKIIVYRTFGGRADAGGSFVTTVPAESRIQAKIDTALLPSWGNSRMYEAVIEVPKGEILNIGKVAEQTTESGAKLVGGGDQVVLPLNWDLNWIKEIRIVPSK